MTFKFEPSQSNQKVFLQINNMSKLTRSGIRSAYFRLGNVLVDEARRSIQEGPKTGRLYRINNRLHRASASGQAPANLSGLLKRSIAYQQRSWNELHFGARAEYAPFLELGTRNMAQRPFLIRSIKHNQKNAISLFETEIKRSLLKGR